MNHTPGPWKWTHGQYKSGEWVSSLDAASDDGVLFHCAFWPIRDANARLIAAAPQLLEALRYYADPENYAEDHWGIRDVIVEHGKAGAKARAAIAKAGG